METRVSRSPDGGSGTLMAVVLAVVCTVAGVGAALLHGSWSSGVASGTAVAASGLGAHKRIADVCMPPLPPPGTTLRRVDTSDEEYRYDRALASPDYFTCALTRERERFCSADEKETLAEELQAYFGFVAAKQRMYDRYVSDPKAKTVMKMADAIEGEGVSAPRQRPEPDASVVALMQDLIREGYLEAGDFGWIVPADIEPYVTGVEPLKVPC